MDAKIHWACVLEVLVKFTVMKLCVFGLLHFMSAWVISQVTGQAAFPSLACCLAANVLAFCTKAHFHSTNIFRLVKPTWGQGLWNMSVTKRLSVWWHSALNSFKVNRELFSRSSSHSRLIECDHIRIAFTACVWRGKCGCQKKCMCFTQLGLFKSFLELENTQPDWTYIF